MSDGRCLRYAYDEVQRRETKHEKVLYVQGTVTNPYTGKTFKHAWVENEVDVIDPTIDVVLRKDKYYERFNPKDVIRVDPFFMLILNAKGHHFFTKAEVKAAIEKDRKFMADLKNRKKK
jgi:hypothetical protein